MRFIPDPELLDSPRGRSALTASPHLNYSAPQISGTHQTKVLVIGAGLAGISMLAQLHHTDPETFEDTMVIDPHGAFARRFLDRTGAINQKTLRSPYEHHLGVHNRDECELIDFARFHWEHLTPIERGQVRVAQGGNRAVVPMDVFESHTDHVVGTHDMNKILRKGYVQKVTQEGSHYVATGEGFEIRAQNVVLCTGEARNDDHDYPGWKTVPWDETEAYRGEAPVAVSGAGLTAAYLLMELLSHNGSVHWVARSEPRFQCSDVDARFFRPEGRHIFRTADRARQDEMLGIHRRSSVMFEFRPRLERARNSGQLTMHKSVDTLPQGTDIITAHGTKPELPAIDLELMDPMLEGRLPVDNWFCVREREPRGLYAMGTHGVYAAGPAARNIDGIRYAAEVIVSQILGRKAE